jgi:nucleotide-binding universal stress UspA family protein
LQDLKQNTPRILTTTDFSAKSEKAYYHALAFTVACQGRLTILHTGSESRGSVPWERFPGVRETMQRWGRLGPDAPREAVFEQLNIGISKMAMRDDDPRQGITDYIRKRPTDLLVMTTAGRTGLARVFNPSVAESVAQQTRARTLMLPHRGRGFIDPDSGKSSLQHVLCALDASTDPRPALAYLSQWLPIFSRGQLEVRVLLFNQPDDTPEVVLPRIEGQEWSKHLSSDDSAEGIAAAARGMSADLVMVTSRERLGLGARMRGSLIDNLLRTLKVPLLSIPPA